MTQAAIEGRDFIIITAQPWDLEIGTNGRNIANVLARTNRVLFVNPPADRGTLLRERMGGLALTGRKNQLVRRAENIWVLTTGCVLESVNWINNPKVHDFLNRINNKRFADSIAAAVRKLHFKDFIFFNDNYFVRGLYAPEYLKPALSIYYSRDYLLGVDYWKKHGERLEPETIRKYDIGVANSQFLTQFLSRHNKNAFYIGQGCNLAHFNEDRVTGLPADLGAIPGPVIGYVGALSSIRLDIDILLHIARARPAWHLVLVGKEDDVFAASALHALPNVHFLGSKHISTIPAYIKGFDVCLNPQLVNQITVGNYPLKVDEYLAMGKPVVATHTEATAQIFDGHVYLADRPEAHVRMIEQGLAEDNPQRRKARKALAATHTWDHCVHEIYRAVAEVSQPAYAG